MAKSLGSDEGPAPDLEDKVPRGFRMKVDGLVGLGGIALLALGWGSTAQAGIACRPDAPFVLSLEGGSLSLDGKNACLGAVLEELARQAHAQIDLPAWLAERPVAASFRKLPIEQGLSRILAGTNYALQTKARGDPPAGEAAAAPERLEVWVVSEKTGPTTVGPVQPGGREGPFAERAGELWEEDEEIDLRALAERARTAPEPEVRGYAIQLFVQGDDKATAVEMVLAGLRDPAPEVRSAALSVVGELGPAAASAVGPIAEIALYDEIPELRMLALHKLVAGDYPREIAAGAVTEALHDPNQKVSDLARNLIDLVTP